MTTSICLAAGDIYIPVKIEESCILSGVYNLLLILRPDWKQQDLHTKVFNDGITNKLIACKSNLHDSDENAVLIRIYGKKTDLLIDRNAELQNLKILNSYGLAAQLYGVFENGLVYQFCPGSILNTNTAVDPKIWPLVAKHMAKMHQVEIAQVRKEPMVWDKIEQFLNLLPVLFTDDNKQKRFTKNFGSVTKLRMEYERLKVHLAKSKSPIVFAHNDLLLGNVIYNEEKNSISFIDYEYAAYNYQAFDMANHFNEFVGLSIEDIDYNKYPSKEFQLRWIKEYLTEFENNSSPSQDSCEKIYLEVQQMSLASHFLWGIWSLVQCELSEIDFNYERYAEIRLGKYYEMKDATIKKTS